MGRPKGKRIGVYVAATTPANYRAFVRLVSMAACATRSDDGGWTVHDESKWANCLSACETAEDTLD